MRQPLFSAIVCCVLVFAACGKDHGPVPATPTSTETVSQTSKPSPSPLKPAAEGITYPAACEISDPSFCEFAKAVDQALRRADIDFLVQHSREQSETCPANMEVGPCVRLAEGTVLRGYVAGAAHTDGGIYFSETGYRSVLADVAHVDLRASDEYGDGTWRLGAVIDQGAQRKVLVSTTIGPDPIYEDATMKRRAFTWAAALQTGEWGLETFLTYTTELITEPLQGVYFGNNNAVAGWVPWED